MLTKPSSCLCSNYSFHRERTPSLNVLVRAACLKTHFFGSRVWMRLVVDRHQLLNARLGIALSCRQRNMPQQFLNCSQVRAVRKQMSGEGMPERVGMKVPVHIADTRILFHQQAYRLVIQPVPLAIQKHSVSSRISSAGENFLADRPVVFKRQSRLIAKRDNALLPAFAKHANHLSPPVDVRDVKAHEFAHAQARSIQHLENEPVALQHQLFIVPLFRRQGPTARLAWRHRKIIEKSVHLFRSQNAGYPFRKFRAAHKPGGIVLHQAFADTELEERAQCRELPRDRRFFQALVVHRAYIFPDDLVVNLIERQCFLARRSEETAELVDVIPILDNRARRRILFVLQARDEIIDYLLHPNVPGSDYTRPTLRLPFASVIRGSYKSFCLIALKPCGRVCALASNQG